MKAAEEIRAPRNLFGREMLGCERPTAVVPTSRKAMLKDLTSARALPSISPLITVNLCHTHRQVTVAVQPPCFPSLPAAGRMIHLDKEISCWQY